MRVSGKRYAQAVFEIACKANQLTEWLDGLKRIANITQNADLVSVLEEPGIAFDLKKQIIDELLEEIKTPLALNLVYLLVAKNRIEIIPSIKIEYSKLLDVYNGIERAVVITAVPIDDGEKDKLLRGIGVLISHKVVGNFAIDPDIIGGVIVRIGDKLIDGSIKNKLSGLKKSLVGDGN
ncbi:MAG: ATP synthase F1 subunit delta [Candidatus Stahlbacteria bacterium]|nr:ATP synthase F1 subunit delta [Candidatus Stahlbacteria bacterium]